MTAPPPQERRVITPPEDKFYGDRMSTVGDPFGHTWHLATHFEDVTPEEIERHMRALFSGS